MHISWAFFSHILMHLFLIFANICLFVFLSVKDRLQEERRFLTCVLKKIYARISFAHQELKLGAHPSLSPVPVPYTPECPVADGGRKKLECQSVGS